MLLSSACCSIIDSLSVTNEITLTPIYRGGTYNVASISRPLLTVQWPINHTTQGNGWPCMYHKSNEELARKRQPLQVPKGEANEMKSASVNAELVVNLTKIPTLPCPT